ncbi:hypothetical protein NM688_g8390 [Phlebia brevispora]|uniref:Uncharacterized protein n=1 Tax=Phlebia brevispora TaxID=194682 RepID=A0ACC1RTR6_9APHY|nr:hypothetical protein NM688_g8390 [Phlebia brevispora]
MDSDKWANWLKSMYGIKAGNNMPQVIVADHSRLIYYDVDQHGEKIKFNSGSIFSTINGAFAGTVSYKHSENIVERLARYLNDKLVVVEQTVSHHPWGVTLVVIGTLGGLALWLRRMMREESALADDLNRKARLD